jgi:hypothetical protein
MKRHRENRTLAEKQHDIKNILVITEQKIGRTWLSANQVASGIGMARNGRLKAMLDWMVDCGILQRREMERSGRWPGYEYALSESVRAFYFVPRQIKLKKNGKLIGQMEMFS